MWPYRTKSTSARRAPSQTLTVTYSNTGAAVAPMPFHTQRHRNNAKYPTSLVPEIACSDKHRRRSAPCVASNPARVTEVRSDICDLEPFHSWRTARVGI
jgi:hypothetical protein